METPATNCAGAHPLSDPFLIQTKQERMKHQHYMYVLHIHFSVFVCYVSVCSLSVPCLSLCYLWFLICFTCNCLRCASLPSYLRGGGWRPSALSAVLRGPQWCLEGPLQVLGTPSGF